VRNDELEREKEIFRENPRKSSKKSLTTEEKGLRADGEPGRRSSKTNLGLRRGSRKGAKEELKSVYGQRNDSSRGTDPLLQKGNLNQ